MDANTVKSEECTHEWELTEDNITEFECQKCGFRSGYGNPAMDFLLKHEYSRILREHRSTNSEPV